VIYYAALVISIVLNALSLILMKSFAMRRETGEIPGGYRAVLHPFVLVSMVCFAVAAATWMVALAGVDLSVAYPTMSVIYVATALAGRAMFGDVLTLQRWIGIALVITGLVITNGA
jgi:multidrug transporter EmrE-like cation transporter